MTNVSRLLLTLGMTAMMAGSAAPSAARPRPVREVRPLPVRQVMITADDRCPRPAGDAIFVCGIRKMARADLRALHTFSRCVAGKRPAEARAILATGYDGGTSRDPLRLIASRELGCAPVGRLSASAMLFAGAIAEALLLPLTRRGGLETRMGASAEGPPIAARGEAEAMSLCAARTAPAGLGILFESEAGSARENDAIRALMPQLSSCLAANVRLVTNPSGLRASLALAAWRLILNSGEDAAPMEVI
jgi:hypothetical protein